MFELHWIELGLYILVAYVWGRYAQWRSIINNLLANPDYFADLLKRYSSLKDADTPKSSQIELRADWVNDICYLYRKDTNEFVGQGRDVDSAIANASGLDDSCDYVIAKDMVKKPEQGQP